VIKAKKKVSTVYSLEMDQATIDQLDLWLLWAFVVWQQCNYHPQLLDEIFHGGEGTDKAPSMNQLSHDKNLIIRLALKKPEVEEV
jgi:hypothetical protein